MNRVGYFFIAYMIASAVVPAMSAYAMDTPVATTLAETDDTFTSEDYDFFENRIRPLLANHCLKCHGAEKSESGFRLDSRAAILAGGESQQPGAVPGDSANSLIVKSVRHESDFEMPPDERLADEQISALSHWVEIGMPWPTGDASLAKTTIGDMIKTHRATHWSFQPIRKPVLSPVVDGDSFTSPIDHLICAKLTAGGLNPSPLADKRTLIRRATFDLIGLPPTTAEVTQFVNDTDPEAYPKLIDRLLASPHYGERWARHWLDVARYADTRGYTFNDGDRNYPFAFTYRDYVIDAFNNDLPFDQFIREQLAADYLDLPPDKSSLAALGFLMVGRKFIARPDTVDDQVDVVTRGFMGLTVSCARCHDHKFEAITTEDYYSLYGIFENCHEPEELPLIGDTSELESYQLFFDELEKRKQVLVDFENEFHRKLQTQMDEHLADYLTRAIAPNNEEQLTQLPAVKLKKNQLNERAIAEWQSYLAQRANADNTTLLPLGAMFGIPEEKFVEQAKQLIEHWNADKTETNINPLVLVALVANPPKTKAEIGVLYFQLLEGLRKRWIDAGSKQPELDQFSGPEQELARLLFEPVSPARINRSKIADYFNVADSKERDNLKKSIDEQHAATPVGVRRAMTIRENDQPHNERVMIRGDIDRRGEEAPRRFLALLSPADRQPFQNRAGRLELADAIANRNNPLTARVIANRIWMHHFSQPLVDTPSDFGIRCPQPMQHELLDYLSTDLLDHGWSIKHLHRTIMLSHAYRQSSGNRDDCVAADPENRLVWKMNRRRLEFESLRDSMLVVAGNLDRALHGNAVDLFSVPFSDRRTIYGKLDRQDLPNLLRVFDLANPDQSAEKRTRTTVPQQSLFMLNNGFTIHQAELLAASVENVSAESDLTEAKIRFLYQTVFQRDPTADEIKIAHGYLESASAEADQLTPWQRYAQILLCTNEFEFVD